MPALRRRSLISSGLAGLALAPWPDWLGSAARAQQPYARHDAASAEGKQMLGIYAAAVAKMAATTPGDPLSWVFQWYTHWVKGGLDPTGKQNELRRIYGNGNSPYRPIAEAVWDTCQAHGENEDENFFLPWHRMFVFIFEQIIRTVSGQAQFSLPYWSYTEASAHAIPAEFRSPTGASASLYRANRNPGVNAGRPIDGGRQPTPLNLDSMRSPTYGPAGADQGFCANLDFGLHGDVHVMVGNAQNMGAIPFAAGDPIFWMHHCNIDRIWASWNKAGGQNPTDAAFLNQSFAFAGTDKRQLGYRIEQVLDTTQLGYSYDTYLQPPVPIAPTTAVAAMRAAPPAPVAAASNVSLRTAAPVRVRLAPEAAPQAKAAQQSLMAELGAATTSRRVYLVLGNFMSTGQPGVVYDVFLNAGAGRAPARNYVGTMNFFAAMPHGGMAHAAPGGMPERKISFEITELAKKLAPSGQLAQPEVTFVPHGAPRPGVTPVVGSVSLVAQ